jgi:hypothetical protein
MPFLSSFTWVCWIKPESKTINALFGTNYGLGMGFLTFDWTQIGLIGNPLIIPWWAQVNILVGFVLFYWLIVPLVYFTNVSHAFRPKKCQLADSLRLGIPATFPSILKPLGTASRRNTTFSGSYRRMVESIRPRTKHTRQFTFQPHST